MDKQKGAKKDFLFSVDILVEGYSNGIALEALLHILNSDKIKDYKVAKGIELGSVINTAVEAAQARHTKKTLVHETPAQGTKAVNEKKQPEAKSTTPIKGYHELSELFNQFKASNTLIRLTILKGKGVKLSIPCRILNLDSETGMLTVYHVDEKKVYQFGLTEVDDYSIGS